MEIGITPNIIAQIGPVPITSGHMTLFVVSVFLLIWAGVIGKNADIVPSRGQVVIEGILNWFKEKIDMSTPKKYRGFNFALAVTLFLMIVLANYFSFLPIFSQITYNGAPLFSIPTAHMSMTMVLAIFVVFLAQIIALITHPIRHIGNYIKLGSLLKVRSVGGFFNALIEIFLGLLDIIGEIAKIVSIAARLFGNMIAGDLLSKVIIGLSVYTSFLAPVPFYALSFLSAIIQAIVFALLAGLFFGSTLQAVELSSDS